MSSYFIFAFNRLFIEFHRNFDTLAEQSTLLWIGPLVILVPMIIKTRY